MSRSLPSLSLKNLLPHSWRRSSQKKQDQKEREKEQSSRHDQEHSQTQRHDSKSLASHAVESRRSPLLTPQGRLRKARKYGGKCLYETEDQWGVIEVIEDRRGRRLHFGNDGIQGRLQIETPWVPKCTYVESMSLASLFLEPTPSLGSPFSERILILGLGCGGLTHTLRKLHPQAQIDVVELRPVVGEVARVFFNFEHAQAQLHITDAFEYLKKAFKDQSSPYSLILIDLYLDQGMIPLLFQPSFWQACELILHPQGLFAVNLWSGDRQNLQKVIFAIQRTFQGPRLLLDHEDVGNLIYFGKPSGFNWEYARHQQSLYQQHLSPSSFDPQSALNRLYQQNQSTFFDLVFSSYLTYD